MFRKENTVKIDYFNIEGTPGGNQDWCTDYWMNLGGCAALASCDFVICLAKNKKLSGCYPYDVDRLTKKDYVDFAMTMKPYIRPRIGGVIKLSSFTGGCGKYLKKCGYDIEFDTLSGDNSYEEACNFIKKSIEKNLPVAYLLLRHINKSLKDLNWHWFSITGYREKDGDLFLIYHTYGEELEVNFKTLWNTGMYYKGGMVAIKNYKKI